MDNDESTSSKLDNVEDKSKVRNKSDAEMDFIYECLVKSEKRVMLFLNMRTMLNKKTSLKIP